MDPEYGLGRRLEEGLQTVQQSQEERPLGPVLKSPHPTTLHEKGPALTPSQVLE